MRKHQLLLVLSDRHFLTITSLVTKAWPENAASCFLWIGKQVDMCCCESVNLRGEVERAGGVSCCGLDGLLLLGLVAARSNPLAVYLFFQRTIIMSSEMVKPIIIFVSEHFYYFYLFTFQL